MRRGSERFIRELSDGLIERGHRPRLITSHPGRPSHSVEDGLPIVRHWRPPDGLLRRKGVDYYLAHYPFSYLSLRRGDDDIAQAVFVTDAVAAARWTAQTARPSIFSFMGIPGGHDRRPGRALLPDLRGFAAAPFQGRLIRRAVRGCSAVTALSRTAAEAFWRELRVEARVIPPGVDLQDFTPADARFPEPTVFCAADVTVPRKRVDLLVRAVELVRRERSGVRLVASRPRDAAAAARFLERSPWVEFADVDDRAALSRAYGDAWVTALPSLGEAFGLVLVEALACGTPVVATDDGGMSEVIDRPEVGRLFSGDRPEPLARALVEALELAEDPATREHCRARAEEFSQDACVERHVELYSELLGASAPAAGDQSRRVPQGTR